MTTKEIRAAKIAWTILKYQLWRQVLRGHPCAFRQ